MRRDAVQKLLTENSIEWMMTGSRAICDPAPIDTDEDYIVLLGAHSMDGFLILAGFIETSDPAYEGGSWMTTWQSGEFNIVTTTDSLFYDRFCAATMLAKHRNIINKPERLRFFRGVLYGMTAYPKYNGEKIP